ncbi:MAG TPA: DUF805 domain-containing protein [Novosphingobium sp.]|nr:DUF805 domain-containing protein [Novosphingobium sp.]
MLEWMLMPYRRYADFSGRSRRKEYWMFFLLVVIVYAICNALIMTGMPSFDPVTGQVSGGGGILSTVGWIIYAVFGLGSLIPSIAVGVRRIHDSDKSGWFILVPIYNLILMFMEGTKGPNRFGPDPKDPAGVEAFT